MLKCNENGIQTTVARPVSLVCRVFTAVHKQCVVVRVCLSNQQHLY